jgi:hypothetical protein
MPRAGIRIFKKFSELSSKKSKNLCFWPFFDFEGKFCMTDFQNLGNEKYFYDPQLSKSVMQ